MNRAISNVKELDKEKVSKVHKALVGAFLCVAEPKNIEHFSERKKVEAELICSGLLKGVKLKTSGHQINQEKTRKKSKEITVDLPDGFGTYHIKRGYFGIVKTEYVNPNYIAPSSNEERKNCVEILNSLLSKENQKLKNLADYTKAKFPGLEEAKKNDMADVLSPRVKAISDVSKEALVNGVIDKLRDKHYGKETSGMLTNIPVIESAVDDIIEAKSNENNNLQKSRAKQVNLAEIKPVYEYFDKAELEEIAKNPKLESKLENEFNTGELSDSQRSRMASLFKQVNEIKQELKTVEEQKEFPKTVSQKSDLKTESKEM